MTDGNSEPRFDHIEEAPRPYEAEKPGAGPAPETHAERLEPQGETGQDQKPVEKKTTDFFNVLRRRRPSPKALPQVRDEVTVRIEKILEDGVGDAYSRLSPVAKQEFKIKGEATARKVRELLQAGHVQVKKIFRLILEWLKILPGINRFFLEQEAKIKTDRILTLHKKQPRE